MPLSEIMTSCCPASNLKALLSLLEFHDITLIPPSFYFILLYLLVHVIILHTRELCAVLLLAAIT